LVLKNRHFAKLLDVGGNFKTRIVIKYI